MLDLDVVEATLHRLFIGVAGTTLRREDQQKALELRPLLAEVARACSRPTGVLVDACAGKSALGLMAAALVLPEGWRVVVVERDPLRVEAARRALARMAPAVAERVRLHQADVGDPLFGLPSHGAASSSNVPSVDVAQTISTASPWYGADVVCALHACGPASDAVIDAAVDAQVRHLLLVPCCYGAHPRQAREAIPGQVLSAPMASVLPRQGVVGRRFAQAVVDAERTLRLEAGGFDVDVLEFVGATVTPHNLLWRGRRGLDARRRAEARQRLSEFTARLAGGALAAQGVTVRVS